MELDNAIAIHLEAYHTGEAQAVTSRELEKTFRVSGPALRKAVNRLRAAGVPICSFGSGYYYAETADELEHTIRQLFSRIKCILHAALGLRKARRKFVDTGQVSLPLGREMRSDGAGKLPADRRERASAVRDDDGGDSP